MAYQPDIIMDLRALDPSRIAMEKEKERREVEEKEKRTKDRGGTLTSRPSAQSRRDVKSRLKSGDGKKETHQDRLKRIMQAQLNKQVQRDNLTTTHRKMQAERDRQARLQIERVAFAHERHESSSPR